MEDGDPIYGAMITAPSIIVGDSLVIDPKSDISLLHSESLAEEVSNDAVIALLKTPAVNRQTDTGETPLHYVCRGNMCTPAVIRLLALHSADMNILCKKGRTPLNQACRYYGDSTSIEELLLAGSHPSYHTGFESNVCHVVRRDSKRSLLILLKYGAMLQGASGPLYHLGYPLHDAVRNNKLDCVKMLVGAGMDINTLDRELHMPLRGLIFSIFFYRDRFSQTKILEILLSAGVHISLFELDTLKMFADYLAIEPVTNMLSCLAERYHNPLSLKACCRISIRGCVAQFQSGGRYVTAISKLGLPAKLVDYILYDYQLMLKKYHV